MSLKKKDLGLVQQGRDRPGSDVEAVAGTDGNGDPTGVTADSAERLGYVTAMLSELRQLVDQESSGILPYLLELAHMEAMQLKLAEASQER